MSEIIALILSLIFSKALNEVVFKEFDMLEINDVAAYYKKWKGWKQIGLHVESFKEVIKEVEFLTKKR